MMGRSKRVRGLLVGLVLTVSGLSLTACSGSDKEQQKPAAGASTAAAEGYPFDTSDGGDDLLSAARTSFSFGKDAPTSWRFPAFYADGETDETSGTIKVDGVRYGIQVVAGTGTTPQARAEKLAAQLDVGKDGIHEVSLGGRVWVAVVDEGTSLSQVVLYGSFPRGVVAGAGFSADVPLKDIPAERIDELHQMVQSIEIEAGSSG
ncbi:hypothetical protein C3E78_11865 [Aeromicrobium chenweiae]|uniref:Uncharacterized protein n=2 Tax=Aeromicrobium chenweiae TaxID=2079793 RepID=A0A2S0WNB8_9ACTN|nr:hypothetical protein C3E78_11865 [Aeromicrobium chenweiae]